MFDWMGKMVLAVARGGVILGFVPPQKEQQMESTSCPPRPDHGPIGRADPSTIPNADPAYGVPLDPWVHRGLTMRCRTCVFYVPKEVPLIPMGHERPQELGRCRRHSPTLSGFPAVYPMDWCGDHKLDEQKI
jgi:hypothetical protein